MGKMKNLTANDADKKGNLHQSLDASSNELGVSQARKHVGLIACAPTGGCQARVGLSDLRRSRSGRVFHLGAIYNEKKKVNRASV